MYAIVTGISYKHLGAHLGVNINKNTWTRYLKDLGIVVGESLEKNRRTKKYRYAQADEVAFGKRKYHWGSRRRKGGVQWAFTMVEVDPASGKTTAIDLQFLPFNKRRKSELTPLIVQRMEEGGELSTDCWAAYPSAAEAAKVSHFTVNHSKEFKNPETGVHTNNCEGMHGVIKRDAFSQFGRLPYLNGEGDTYYLDLLVWRANVRLQGELIFKAFCKDLWQWTHHGLEDWNRKIPLYEAEPEDDLEVDEEEQEEGET